MPDREHAVIYIPADVTDPARFAELAAPCLERVEACGYVFSGIVRHWDDAKVLIAGERAHVIIVADTATLPRNRRPRIEAARDPIHPRGHCVVLPEATQGSRSRRPRRVR